MIILAVETSCDDTAIALIKASKKKKLCFEVLSNVVSSQIKIHRKWGGVYPALAKREHQRNLIPTMELALKKARMLKMTNFKFPRLLRGRQISNKNPNVRFQKLKKILKREKNLYEKLEKFLKKYQKPEIDAIAITVGPGLEPCLWVGVNFVKTLSYYWNVPVIPVNHIKAHILVNWLPQNSKIKLPAVALIASGGHTQLILMKNFGKYKILGETRDDAAGECFDKTAKILGLEYPGGPAIAAEAAKFQISNFKFQKIELPRPMLNTKDYDFSFSGLKTAVLYTFRKQPIKKRKSKAYIKKMSYEIQQAIIDVLISKTLKATENYKAKTIILGGGVISNNELRKQFKERAAELNYEINILMPQKKLCTDNAAMTGIAGWFEYKNRTKNWKNLKARARNQDLKI